MAESRAVGNADAFGLTSCEFDHVGVVLDAERARRMVAGRGQHDLAIARSEVDDIVAGSDLGQLQHPLDQPVRCGNPDHVLAVLASGRLVPGPSGPVAAGGSRGARRIGRGIGRGATGGEGQRRQRDRQR
jgi:hypothetical protein